MPSFETRLHGTHQYTDTITDNIRNYAVTAIKLNPDVAGNGIILDDNNRISFTGYTIVKNEQELLHELASGELSNILVREGTYNIGGNLTVSRPVSIIGDNKKTTFISLSPAGQLLFTTTSGQVVTGTADYYSPNYIIVSNPSVSGTMTLGSYDGASLILDDIPYKVVSVVSGEALGTAILQLAEPYAGESFTGKDFKLQYLLDFVVLKNLSVSSAYNDGIVKIDRARNVMFENVELRGSDVISNPSQGAHLKEVYFGILNNVDVTLTNVTLPLNESKEYGIYIRDSRYISADNVNIYNTNSNGLYLHLSKFIEINGLKASSIDGNPLRINGCYNISISSSYLKDFGLKSTILNSDQIIINTSTFSSLVDRQAIEITESHVNLINNNFYNTYVKVTNNTQESIIASNEFENVTSTTNALYLTGKDKAIVTGNIFNTLATNGVLVYSGDAIITDNYFSNSTNAVNLQQNTQATLSNNVIEDNINGIVVDATSNSNINNNVFTVSNYALDLSSTGNYITGNTLISGTINSAFGNVFPFYTTFEPYYSGLVDIASNTKPIKDIYVNNAVRAKNVILNNGSLFGAKEIVLSGHVVTVDASHLYIDGEDLAGLSLTDLQYVHNQILTSASWTVKHNLKTKNVAVTIYDDTDQMVEPVSVSNIDVNKVNITFGYPIKGRAIVHSAGTKSLNTGFTGEAYVHTQSTVSPIWTITHNLQSKNIIVQTYDVNNEMYLPSTIKYIDENTVIIYNSYAKAGKAVIFAENAFVAANTSQYIHRQTVASSTWTISHNRGSKDFAITFFNDDVGGSTFTPTSVTINDENSVLVTTASPTVGRAVLVFASAATQKVVDVRYTHDQPTLSTTWDILHNLNTTDVVVIPYDTAGKQIFSNINQVQIIDEDYVQIQFSAAKSGKAVVIAPISSNRLQDLEDKVGNLNTLDTNNQTSIVDSINEVVGIISSNDINRNRITNGDFRFSNEYGNYNSGLVVSGVPYGIQTTGTYVADLFKYDFSGSAQVVWDRTTDVPNTANRSQHSIRFRVISGETTDINDYYAFNIPIEGYKISDTYNDITSFSFYAKTNKPGTYSVAFRGSYSTDPLLTTYIAPFTLGSINTWEKIEIPLIADANWPSWNADQNIGMNISIVMAAGSGYLSVADGAWYADNTTDYRSQTHDMNLTEFTSGELYITRIKYEKGGVATEFIPPDLSDELRTFERYYQILSGKYPVTTFSGVLNDAYLTINHREQMRTPPTVVVKHGMFSYDNIIWSSGTISADSTTQYSTTLSTSFSGSYRLIGGDGTYDGTNSFVIHNIARL